MQTRRVLCAFLSYGNTRTSVRISKQSSGYNSVVLSASSPEGSIYSVGCVDGDGFELPVGLPAFILFDGQSCRLVDGEEGLALSSRLFGDE